MMNLIEPWCWAAGVAGVWATDGLTPATTVAAWGVAMLLSIGIRARSCLKIAPLTFPRWTLLSRSLRFGLPAWIGGMAGMVNFRVDQLLMGFISTEAALGVYAVSVNCSEVLLYLPTATAGALMPLIARTVDSERAERALRAYRGVTLVTLLSTVFALALGPFLIPLVFGSRYSASVVPFAILALGSVGWAATVFFSSALLGSSSPGHSSLGSVASLVVGIALDVLLIPPFGATGAAVGATAAFFAGGAVSLMAFRRRYAFSLLAVVPGPEDVRWLIGVMTSMFAR